MRLFVPYHDRRPDPEPLPSNDRRTVTVITVGWAFVFVVMLLYRTDLEVNGNSWWIWTPPIAILLGLIGLRWMRRLGS